ncbi:hypothetical protein BD626DRAFT_477459 [Schizophyllum amplum]|uniref:Uncharacterized protein n=1 Tax=Schizophyllum amplum TaxID=97359 RepID=A0A550D071_9AGAR|nr:hypothetical protein BD626DRAFT_477459 [Auriculariopsis ampla]
MFHGLAAHVHERAAAEGPEGRCSPLLFDPSSSSTITACTPQPIFINYWPSDQHERAIALDMTSAAQYAC